MCAAAMGAKGVALSHAWLVRTGRRVFGSDTGKQHLREWKGEEAA